MRLLLLPLLLATALHAAEPLTLADALRRPQLAVEITGGTPATISVKNQSPEAIAIAQPAGLICKGARGDERLVMLRALDMTVAPNAAADAKVPAALLGTGDAAGAFVPTAEQEPRLAPLLEYLAAHNDVPKLTAQLLVHCVLDDIGFAAWERSLAIAPGAEPPPEDVVAAVDALGVLRKISPEGKFALASDAELKLRALRNPVARGKAMQLYGINLPEAPLPPDLGSLLHTRPGDNCPICRQRALMQPREDGL